MYCPKCSQEQASVEQRFCSRCGFPLTGVAELIAGGGVPSPAKPDESPKQRSARFRGVRQGVALMMLAAVVLPLVEIIPDPLHEALLFVLLIGGIMRIAYAFAFQEGAKRSSLPEETTPLSVTDRLNASADQFALPSAESMPVNDLVTPHKERVAAAGYSSVTENTTKLLEQEKDTTD